MVRSLPHLRALHLDLSSAPCCDADRDWSFAFGTLATHILAAVPPKINVTLNVGDFEDHAQMASRFVAAGGLPWRIKRKRTDTSNGL